VKIEHIIIHIDRIQYKIKDVILYTMNNKGNIKADGNKKTSVKIYSIYYNIRVTRG
jgi:hypothetical protein